MIKTIVKDTTDELDNAANEFEKSHKVFASSTESIVLGDKVSYKITLCYKES